MTSHYLGDYRTLVQTRHGPRMILDTRDIIMTPLILLNGEWEPETTRTLLSLLRPGQHFVDVGANMGYFSCLAARTVLQDREGHVTAFEADPELFGVLRDNINLNWHFEGVTLINAAAYREEATLTFQKRTKYQGNSSLARLSDELLSSIGDAGTTFQVPAVALDHIINRRIDIVKVDVEGAEPFVFEGMQRLLSEQREAILMVEWSPTQIAQSGRQPAELLSLMAPFDKHLILDTLSPVSDAELATVSHGMVLLTR